MITIVDTYPMFENWNSHHIQLDPKIDIWVNHLTIIKLEQLLKLHPITLSNHIKRILKINLIDYIDKLPQPFYINNINKQ